MKRFLVAIAAAPCAAWVTKSQSMYGAQIAEIQAQMNGDPVWKNGNPSAGEKTPQALFGWLWHMPDNVYDNRGLGGGITYAWDPALCPAIQPRFSEDIFGFNLIDCGAIQASVARAFDKWAANNRFFKFVDVTAECTLYGWGTSTWTHPTVPLTETSQTTRGCPLAEIWITRYQSGSGRRLDDLSNVEEDSLGRLFPQPHRLLQQRSSDGQGVGSSASALDGGVAVATAQPIGRYVTDFKYTNGQRPFNNANSPYYNSTVRRQVVIGGGMYNRRVVEVFQGIFSFNADSTICWYMDSTFCSGFHRLKSALGNANNARLLVYGCTYGTMAIGILFYICFIGRVCMRASGIDADHVDDEDGDGSLSLSERINAGVRAISHFNPMVLTIFIACWLVPPLVTDRLFKPCFDCYDFEAAALHEIGHFLGLGHPDNIPLNWEYPRLDWAGPIAGNNSYQADIAAAALSSLEPNIPLVCTNPWQAVRAGYPAATPSTQLNKPGTYTVRNAQMEARTQHNPLSCLLPDDIEGLKVMYPDCGTYSLTVPVCHNVQSYVGIVRIAVYVLIPCIFALLAVVCFSSIVHGFERREKVRLEAKHEELKDAQAEAKKGALVAKLKLAAVKAQQQKSRRDRGRTPSTSGAPTALARNIAAASATSASAVTVTVNRD